MNKHRGPARGRDAFVRPVIENRHVVFPAAVEQPVALKIRVLVLISLLNGGVWLDAAELLSCLIGAQLRHRKGQAELRRDGQQHRLHQRFPDLETAGIGGHGPLNTHPERRVGVIAFKKAGHIFRHGMELLFIRMLPIISPAPPIASAHLRNRENL